MSEPKRDDQDLNDLIHSVRNALNLINSQAALIGMSSSDLPEHQTRAQQIGEAVMAIDLHLTELQDRLSRDR
jgi:transaldolase